MHLKIFISVINGLVLIRFFLLSLRIILKHAKLKRQHTPRDIFFFLWVTLGYKRRPVGKNVFFSDRFF